MFDTDTTALLRAVLDEVCEGSFRYETGARAHVASKILEAAAQGQTSVERLMNVGRSALRSPYRTALTADTRLDLEL